MTGSACDPPQRGLPHGVPSLLECKWPEGSFDLDKLCRSTQRSKLLGLVLMHGYDVEMRNVQNLIDDWEQEQIFEKGQD